MACSKYHVLLSKGYAFTWVYSHLNEQELAYPLTTQLGVVQVKSLLFEDHDKMMLWHKE
jgi:hypothetical protein